MSSRTLIYGEEHQTVELPRSIVSSEGQLDVYEDVLKLFQIRYKRKTLVLQLDRYVGYIPINDSLALQVNTRIPIANLERLVAIASGYTPSVLHYSRAYARAAETPSSITDFIAEALLAAADLVFKTGLLSEYLPKHQIGQHPKGKLDVARSTWLTQKSGRPLAVSSSFERTKDVAANRIIKAALRRLLTYYVASAPHRPISVRLKSALVALEGVQVPSPDELNRAAFASVLKHLPPYHEAYAKALLLSQLVLEGAGLSIREPTGNIRLPSILVDMEKVFESYARVLLERRAAETGKSIAVLDGNKGGAQGARVSTFEPAAVESNPGCTPDIVIKQGGTPALIIDAKYKPAKQVPDRADLNQIVLYAARYSCPKVMVLYPERSGHNPHTAHLGMIGSVAVFTGHINLAKEDIPLEEQAFCSEIFKLVPAS